MRNKLTVFLSLLAVPCLAAPKPTGPVVKLKIIAGSPVVDDVFLNGHGPYRFLLDTGAETNLVEAGLARKLGIEPAFQTKLITAAGTTPVEGSAIERVSLGPAEASHQEFLFTALDGLHVLSPDIRGILGQPFLSRFDYTLDFQNHVLTFGAEPEGGSRVPFRLIHNRMALPTSEGDLVLDSGTSTLFLFRAAPFRGTSVALQASTGMMSPVAVDWAPELRIAGRVYHPGRAAFDDARDTSLGNGLLPVSLFKAVFVSNSGGYLVLDPQSKK